MEGLLSTGPTPSSFLVSTHFFTFIHVSSYFLIFLLVLFVLCLLFCFFFFLVSSCLLLFALVSKCSLLFLVQIFVLKKYIYIYIYIFILLIFSDFLVSSCLLFLYCFSIVLAFLFFLLRFFFFFWMGLVLCGSKELAPRLILFSSCDVCLCMYVSVYLFLCPLPV